MLNISLSSRGIKPGLKLAEITDRKTYGQTQISGVMDLRSFSQHIASHGSVYRRHDVQAILMMMSDCLREMLLAGMKVELGDLGSFSPTISTEGAEEASKFSSQNIKKVGVNWTPGPMFKNLMGDATFQLVPSRKAVAEALARERGLETGNSDENTDNNSESGNGNNNEGEQQPGGNGGGDDGGGNGDGIE